MKEALLVFVVLLVLAGLTAYRYRRQLMAVLNLWRTLQTIRQTGRQSASQIRDDATTAAGPLVNCPKCGTWVTEDKAIKLGRAAYYCSTKCLEASVRAA